MSDLRVGQDVLVETDAVYEGEAFIASVDEETETVRSDGVYIDLRGRNDLGAEIALVPREAVVSLTEVFDTIRNS